MAIDAIVRVSFQSVVEANQGANRALVGLAQGSVGSAPFEKASTATYVCSGGGDSEVAEAVVALGQVILQYSDALDFVSISLAKRTKN